MTTVFLMIYQLSYFRELMKVKSELNAPGVDDFMIKPFNSVDVHAKVKVILRRTKTMILQ